MFINPQRPVILAAAGAVALAVGPVPALAQADANSVLNVLVECGKIDDPSARLACYDNNVRRAADIPRATIPGQTRVEGGDAPIAATEGPAGFGRETVRAADRFLPPAGELQSIRPRVTAVAQRGQGLYIVTVEDGAQWEFQDTVGLTYRAPRVNSIVEIERGSLGSFLMRVDGQRPIQVRRIR